MLKMGTRYTEGTDESMYLLVFDASIGVFIYDERYYFDFTSDTGGENKHLYRTISSCWRSDINCEPVHMSLGVIYNDFV